MKRAIITISAVLLLASPFALMAQQEPKQSAGSHLGTWRLTSYKYGTGQESFTTVPQTERRLKLITDTHFTWVQFDPAARTSQGMAGGTYTLVGDAYTESIDFADPGMASYLGAKHTFKIRIEGDQFFLSGSLADGLEIEEVWQRVK
jgi:hypothetical protein